MTWYRYTLIPFWITGPTSKENMTGHSKSIKTTNLLAITCGSMSFGNNIDFPISTSYQRGNNNKFGVVNKLLLKQQHHPLPDHRSYVDCGRASVMDCSIFLCLWAFLLCSSAITCFLVFLSLMLVLGFGTLPFRLLQQNKILLYMFYTLYFNFNSTKLPYFKKIS